MRRLLVFVMAVVVLAGVNFEIYKKEQLLAEGMTVFLELVPRDPLSFMQGYYMVLRYRIATVLELKTVDKDGYKVDKDGYIVIVWDDKKVARFSRVYEEGTVLEKNELLLHFRFRQRHIQLGAESFFFQEGHAKYYNNARYGELRVTTSGEIVLVGLRDEKLNPLGAPVEEAIAD
jgi:uncharacterized membrane-anchored protein